MPAMRSTHGCGASATLADEVGPQLPHEPRPGGRVGAQRVDQVDALLLAVGGDGAAAVRVDREGEVLDGVVVAVGAELVAVVVGAARAETGQVPAGEHARRRLDVVLDDVGDAEREQLHDLAGVVLLGRGWRCCRGRPATPASPDPSTRRPAGRGSCRGRARGAARAAPWCRRDPRTAWPPASASPRCRRRRRRSWCRRSRSGCARRAPSSPGAGARSAPA